LRLENRVMEWQHHDNAPSFLEKNHLS